MKKIISFLFLATILVSCTNNTDYRGKWIDKKTETQIINITKSNNNFIVESQGNKYPASLSKGALRISYDAYNMTALIDENDNLILDGKEYIRFEISRTNSKIGVFQMEKQSSSDLLAVSDQFGNFIEIYFENGLKLKEYNIYDIDTIYINHTNLSYNKMDEEFNGTNILVDEFYDVKRNFKLKFDGDRKLLRKQEFWEKSNVINISYEKM